MNPQFIIDTIHERRAGIDMITMPFDEHTHYGESDAQLEGEGNTEAGGREIPRS